MTYNTNQNIFNLKNEKIKSVIKLLTCKRYLIKKLVLFVIQKLEGLKRQLNYLQFHQIIDT